MSESSGASTSRAECLCVTDYYDSDTSPEVVCTRCPVGSVCNGAGNTLTALPVVQVLPHVQPEQRSAPMPRLRQQLGLHGWRGRRRGPLQTVACRSVLPPLQRLRRLALLQHGRVGLPALRGQRDAASHHWDCSRRRRRIRCQRMGAVAAAPQGTLPRAPRQLALELFTQLSMVPSSSSCSLSTKWRLASETFTMW